MSILRILKANGNVQTFTVNKLPSKSNMHMKVVRHGDITMGVNKSGKLYGLSGLPNRNFSYIGWTWGWLPEFTEILYKLGMITVEDRDATVKRRDEERKREDEKCHAQSVIREFESLGMTLTKHQLNKLKGFIEND